MASITETRSRGQLILIGALALAVSLVAIALVLNSAIYTHNLASRADASGDDTITYARDVRISAGGMVDYANRNFSQYGSPGTSDTILGEYIFGLKNISDAIAENSAQGAQLSSVQHVSGSDVEGVRIVDNDTEFQPVTGTPTTWNVTAEARVRHFRVDVNGSLASQGDSDTLDQIDDIDNGLLGSLDDDDEAFVVEFDNGSITRYVAIYNDTSTGNPTVLVHDGDEELGKCRVDSLPAGVDFASASFGREVCPGLSFVDDLSGPYGIQYYNGANVSGEYELIADVPIDGHTAEVGAFTDTVDSLNYDAQCDGPTYNSSSDPYPRVEPAVYATDLTVTYETADVTYNSTQRVANDEPGAAPEAPRVTEFDVEEANSDAADGNFTVMWSAVNPNGTNVDTTIVVIEPDDDTKTIPDPGPSPADIDVDGESGDYEITLVVDDGSDDLLIDGNNRNVTEIHTDDGDESGCPP